MLSKRYLLSDKLFKYTVTTLFSLFALIIIIGDATAGEGCKNTGLSNINELDELVPNMTGTNDRDADSSYLYKPSLFKQDHLTDILIHKQRSTLQDYGISYDAVYIQDFISNHGGGMKRAGADIDGIMESMSHVYLTMELDTEAAGLWKNGTLFSSAFYHDGANPTTDFIGDLQIAENYMADDGFKIYELWYEHSFDLFGTELSLLAGLHDLNGEFSVTEYGLLFVQSSFGFNNEISNNIAVANYPVAALGFRAKWDIADNFFYRGEISDGDPGRDNCGLRHVNLGSKDGFVTFHEMVYHFGDMEDSKSMPGTYKMGGWYHSDEFDDVRDTDANGNAIVHDGNYGIYFIADQMLLPGEGDTGMGAFFQIGGVPDDRNQVDFYVGAGIHYKGIIPQREDDIFGLAIAYAQIGDDQRDVDDLAEDDPALSFHSTDSHETVIELTYKTQVLAWLAVQPGVQRIFNPGAVADYDDAFISILRFQVNL